MALSWKLVIGSTNAPALADFWAAALGYEVEDPSVLIERHSTLGNLGPADCESAHAAVCSG
jgi:hypothetical protein